MNLADGQGKARLIESYETRNTKILQDLSIDLDSLYCMLTNEIYFLKKSTQGSDEDFTLLGYLNYLQGKIDRYRLNFVGALRSLMKAKKVITHSNSNAHLKAKIMFHLGVVLLSTKEKTKAHEYFLKASSIFNAEGNINMFSRIQKLRYTLIRPRLNIRIEENIGNPDLNIVNAYINKGKYLDKVSRLVEANHHFVAALDFLDTSIYLYHKPESLNVLIPIVEHLNRHQLWEDAEEVLNKYFQLNQQRFKNHYLIFKEVYEMNLANEKISINYEQLLKKNEQEIECDDTLALLRTYKYRIGVSWNGDSYKVAQYYKNLAYCYLKFYPKWTKARKYANRSMIALSKLSVLQKKSVLSIIKQLLEFYRYINSNSERKHLEEIIENKLNYLLARRESYFPNESLNFSLAAIYSNKLSEYNRENWQLLPLEHTVYSRKLTLFLKIIPIYYNKEALDQEILFLQSISQNRFLGIHEINDEFIAFEPILLSKNQKEILKRVRTELIRTEILEILITMKDLNDLELFVGNINPEMFYIAAKEKQLKIGVIEEFMSYKFRTTGVSLKKLKRLWKRSKMFRRFTISPESYILDKLRTEVFHFNAFNADKFSLGASLLYLVMECTYINSKSKVELLDLYEKHIKIERATNSYEIDDLLQLEINLIIDEIELFDWIKPTLKSLMKVNWHNRSNYEKVISVYEENIKVPYYLLKAL